MERRTRGNGRRTFVFGLVAAGLLAGCHSKDRFVGVPPATPYSYHGDIGGAGAVIVWRTDSAASSIVEYGPETRYGLTAGNPADRVQFHKINLTGLSSSALYHMRVKSVDDSGNNEYSYDQNFRTFPSGVAPGSYHRFNDDFQGNFHWTVQTYTDSQGITSSRIVRSAEGTPNGSDVLRAYVNLASGDAHLSKGEVYLESAGADDKAGDGVSVNFQDMTGKSLQADVYAPSGSDMCGTYGTNAFQMFVKDVYFRSQYGPWTAINASALTTPQMTIGNPAVNAWTDAGFDPSTIATVGVKIGLQPAGPGACSSSTWGRDYISIDNVQVTP